MKRISGWAAAVAAALALSGCAPAPTTTIGGPAPIVLRYASPYPPTHPFSRADIAWMKRVEALSHGRLHIEPFWGGTLVSSDEATLELAHGVADIALVTPIYNRAGMRAVKTQAGFYEGAATPAAQVAVYRCLERQFPVLDREMAGVRVLAVQGGNLPNILTRSRPVTALDQIRGMRLRTPAELAPLLRQFGASPVTMPMGEVYASLSKGGIDGVIAPADTLKSLHFSEVAPYLSQLAIPRGAYPARAISDRAWARLPPELQADLADSQTYWQDQLDSSVVAAERAGLTFGRTHGERVTPVGPAEQAQFDRLYDAASLEHARSSSTPAFDGPAMFKAAQQAIAALKAGRPACGGDAAG